MKSKKSIYILLPLVIFIWGAVVYQFFSFSPTEITELQNGDIRLKPFIIKSKDTFSIQVNKRDPFLGKMITNEASLNPKSLKPKQIKVKEEVLWPDIKYKGIVSDNKEKIKVYMLVINGTTYLMKKGDEENGVKLKDGDREIVYAVYQGDLKVIFIQ